jgi:hypothetical protein
MEEKEEGKQGERAGVNNINGTPPSPTLLAGRRRRRRRRRRRAHGERNKC